MDASERLANRLIIVSGNIVTFDVEAIVNAANSSLLGGGGVDGAIHRAAGPQLLEECRWLNGCASGAAKLTGGYRLRARYVIHTVGPVWFGGRRGEPETLAACYRNCLALAIENGLSTLAFPAISCGAYRYPVERAAAIAIPETAGFLEREQRVEKIFLVCFDGETLSAYNDAYRQRMETRR